MDEAQTTVRAKGQVNRLESLGSRSEGAAKMPFLKQQKPPRRLEGRKALNNVAAIQLDRITPDPNQPRKEFEPDALKQLAESIRERQLQPINVRWDEGLEQYIIISGERRYRACQLAGLATIDCMVVEGDLSESDIRRTQLIENCLREDLRPLERANAFQELMRLNGWNAKELAQSLNLSASTITQALSLLEQPEPIRQMVEEETLPARTAYEIQKLDDPKKQVALAERVVNEKLTRDQTAKAVRQLKGKATASRKPKPAPLPEPPPEPPKVRAYRFPKGTRIAITIPGDADLEDVDALEQALAQAGASEAELAS